MEEHHQYYQQPSSSSSDNSTHPSNQQHSHLHNPTSSHPFVHPSSTSNLNNLQSRQYQPHPQQQQGRGDTHSNQPTTTTTTTQQQQLPSVFNPASNPNSNPNASPSLSHRGSIQSQSPSLSHQSYHHQQQQQVQRNNSIPNPHPSNSDFYPQTQRSNSYSHSSQTNYSNSHHEVASNQIQSPRLAGGNSSASAGSEIRPSPQMQPSVMNPSSGGVGGGNNDGRYPGETGVGNPNGVRGSEMAGPSSATSSSNQEMDGNRSSGNGQNTHSIPNEMSYHSNSGGFDLHPGGGGGAASSSFPPMQEARGNPNAGNHYAHQPSMYHHQFQPNTPIEETSGDQRPNKKRKSSASQESYPHSQPPQPQSNNMPPVNHSYPPQHQHHSPYPYPDPVSSSAMSAYGHHPTSSYSTGMYPHSHMYPNGTLASPSGMTPSYPYGAGYGCPSGDPYSQPQTQGIPSNPGGSTSQLQRSNSVSSSSENGGMVPPTTSQQQQQQQQQVQQQQAQNSQFGYHPYGYPQNMRYSPQNMNLHSYPPPHPQGGEFHPYHSHHHLLPPQPNYGYGHVAHPPPHPSSGVHSNGFHPHHQQQQQQQQLPSSGRSGSMSAGGKSTEPNPKLKPNPTSFPSNSSAVVTGKKAKKKSPPPAPIPKAPTKSQLNPPKKSPSAWQLYFADDLAEYKKNMNQGDKLNVAQVAKEAALRYKEISKDKKESYKTKAEELKKVWEKEMNDWKETLSPKDIAQENLFRSAQRKAGKSRKSNIKDPNAPQKPLSAYFLFLREIRSDDRLQKEIFNDEHETTRQSVLAATKWRSMTAEEKNVSDSKSFGLR